jgi:L-iditol 2-dehydrogenase
MHATAAVVVGPGAPLEIQSVELPPLEPGAMLVEVEAATLCGTDVSFWRAGGRDPYIPGHETCGRVVAMEGARHDVLGRKVELGDRIIWSYPFCGECFYCAVAKQPTYCSNAFRFGREPVDRFPRLLGGCATHHYVPPRSGVVSVPDNVPSALAASGACALRTVMHGFEMLGGVSPHEVAVVQGSGPVGLYATAVAVSRGFRTVLTIGAPAARLEVATAWGASATLNLEEMTDRDDRREWVLERTAGRGADVVIQCAGSAAIPEGLALCRPGGRYVSIGGGSAEIQLSPLSMSKTFLSVRSGNAEHFYDALQFLARAEFPFERLLTGTYPLSKVTDALRAMQALEEVKPMIAVDAT